MRQVNVSEVWGSRLVLCNIFFLFFFGSFGFVFVFVFIFRKTCFHFLTDLKYTLCTGRLIADSFSHFISKVQ